MVKPEPVEDPILSRKRSGTLSVFREVVPKKVKAEPENLPIAKANTKSPPSMTTEAIRGELTDLQAKVNHLKPQLERARRKTDKSTGQLTREKNLTGQLIDLYRRIKELTKMIPDVSAPVHPIPGPSFQNGFVQSRSPPALVQPSVTSAPVASGSGLNFPPNPFKDEPMDTDSDSDNATPPPWDMDHFHSLGEDDKGQMLADATNLGADFYNYTTAKADEWAHFLAFQFPPTNLSI